MMIIPILDNGLAFGVTYGVKGMLEVYMMDKLDAKHSDVAEAFLMFSIGYGLIAIPTGMVLCVLLPKGGSSRIFVIYAT